MSSRGGSDSDESGDNRPAPPLQPRPPRERSEVLRNILSLFATYSSAAGPAGTSSVETASELGDAQASSVDDDGGEELAVDAAVRVHDENVRLRGLVEQTAAHLQRSLGVLHARGQDQQRAVAELQELAAARERLARTLHADLQRARAEADELRVLLDEAARGGELLRAEAETARRDATSAQGQAAAQATARSEELQLQLQQAARDQQLQLERQRLELQAEHERDREERDALERDLAEERERRAELARRLARLSAEAAAQAAEAERERALRDMAAQQPSAQTRAELLAALRRCAELQTSVAHLTADKDRLAALLQGRGRLLAGQHWLGAVPPPAASAAGQHWLGGGAPSLLLREEAAESALRLQQEHAAEAAAASAPGALAARAAAAAEATVAAPGASTGWRDAPSWVPVGCVETAAAFRRRHAAAIGAGELHDFLLACNGVWHARLQAVAEGLEREAAKKSRWRAPYREVLQASTITRLRQTVAALQALLQRQRPFAAGFAAASVDLPRLTSGELALVRHGGAGADMIASRLSAQRSGFGIGGGSGGGSGSGSGFVEHTATTSRALDARLLSVPGSGSQRLDGEESAALLAEAMRCVDFLARRLEEVEAAQGHGGAMLQDEAAERGASGHIYAQSMAAQAQAQYQQQQQQPLRQSAQAPPPPPQYEQQQQQQQPYPRTLRFDEELDTTRRSPAAASVARAVALSQSPPRFNAGARSLAVW